MGRLGGALGSRLDGGVREGEEGSKGDGHIYGNSQSERKPPEEQAGGTVKCPDWAWSFGIPGT